MDDGEYTEIKELVFSDEIENRSGFSMAAKKQRVEDKEVIEAEEHHSDSNGGVGVMSNLISILVPRDKEAAANNAGGDGELEERKPEEEREGGIFSNFISNLVSPRGKAEDTTTATTLSSSVDDQTMVNEEKGGGGIFNNLISGILNPSTSEVESDKGNEPAVQAEDGGSGGRGGGGGVIGNLVSQLPSPLSDDAAPATDEASILIHSIVHD